MTEPAEQLPDILTPEEAAKLLRVATRTLYDVIKTTRPPWAKRIGRVIRIHRGKLLESFGAPANTNRKR